MMPKLQKTVLIIMAVAILGCLFVINYSKRLPGQSRSDSAYLALLKDAYSTVLAKYVDKPDPNKLAESMVAGMLSALDPHSAYLPPEPYHEMEVQMSGAFGGVGIELGIKDDRLTVISPIEDTPAFRAGIQANDQIWKIDKQLTRGMNISAAVKLMRGEKGKPVSLTIIRNGSPVPLVFNLVRDIIKIKSLKSRMLDRDIGLIRISQFQAQTGTDFKKALADLHAESGGRLRGLVIDLRYNPGGLLESSVEVVNCFIGDDIKNTVIVSLKGRGADHSRTYNATVGEKEPRYPIVVLINGGSASASEIVAGALQDHKRAIIMGRQSFGKGSVQSVFPLKGAAAVKLTTARYYTPSGRSIQASGIIPDIDVPNITPLPPKGKETVIRESDLEKSFPSDGKMETTEKGSEYLRKPANSTDDLSKDFQLSRALELLRSFEVLKGKGY